MKLSLALLLSCIAISEGAADPSCNHRLAEKRLLLLRSPDP
jgi:hypothetical protein